jgi:hypothetical protein
MRYMIFTALLVFAIPTTWAQPEKPIDVGDRLELLVDQYLIGSMEGTSLRLHAPLPAEEVLAFDHPWEGRYAGYVTVFQDGDRFRMYYRGLPEARADGSDSEVTCYAESADGIHFTKPDLGLFEVHGSRNNNVVLANNAPFSHNFAPFIDTRPGVPASERYKALAGTSKTGLVGFVSTDGLQWRKLREEPLISEGAFDSQNVAFWSESEQAYVAYFRTWSEGEFHGCRWVSRATSPDFLTWSAVVEMDKGDAPWEHIYTNQTVAYPRAPHIYMALAARFMPGRRAITEEEAASVGIIAQYSGDCSDSVLMTSRGGNRYDRTFLGALIKPGIGPANWTSRTNYPARGIVQTGDHELSVYIQHHYGQETGHLRRYTLRLDGFASINAPYAGGEWVSKALRFSGSQLHLNFATSAAGGIQVAVEHAAQPGFSLRNSEVILGNSTDRVVTWKNGADLSALAGQPVRLRFHMKDADLFALQFK